MLCHLSYDVIDSIIYPAKCYIGGSVHCRIDEIH